MICAHFTLPCLYLAQEKIVDRLNIPSLVVSRPGWATIRRLHRQSAKFTHTPPPRNMQISPGLYVYIWMGLNKIVNSPIMIYPLRRPSWGLVGGMPPAHKAQHAQVGPEFRRYICVRAWVSRRTQNAAGRSVRALIYQYRKSFPVRRSTNFCSSGL